MGCDGHLFWMGAEVRGQVLFLENVQAFLNKEPTSLRGTVLAWKLAGILLLNSSLFKKQFISGKGSSLDKYLHSLEIQE